jgi:hypothetical protein
MADKSRRTRLEQAQDWLKQNTTPEDRIYQKSLPQGEMAGQWLPRGPGVITDDKWDDWYYKQSRIGDDHKLHQRFVGEMDQLLDSPVIQDAVGKSISPLNFMIEYLANDEVIGGDGNDDLKAAVLANARANLAGLPPVDNKFGMSPQSAVVRELVAATIDATQDSAAYGQGADFAPVREGEYANWQEQEKNDPTAAAARFRLTGQGQGNFDRLRAANLMRTFQSGENAPEFASVPSAMLGSVGAVAAGLERGFRLDPLKREDTLDVMGMGGRAMDVTPAGRLRESMYWFDNSERPALPSQYAHKDAYWGGKQPQNSATTPFGVGTNLTRNENYASSVNLPFRTFWQQPLETSPDQREAINAVGNSLFRTTPQIADDADPLAATRAMGMYENRASQNEGWLGAQWPRVAHAVNNAAGGEQVIRPEYLSQASDFVGNLPRWVLEDLFSTTQFGAGLGKAAIGGMARSAAEHSIRPLLGAMKNFGKKKGAEFLSEIPNESGTEAAINPPQGNPFQAMQGNSFMGSVTDPSSGQELPFPGDAPQHAYEDRYEKVIADRQADLKQMEEDAKTILPASSRRRLDKPYSVPAFGPKRMLE